LIPSVFNKIHYNVDKNKEILFFLLDELHVKGMKTLKRNDFFFFYSEYIIDRKNVLNES